MREITRFLYKLSTVAEIRRNPLTGHTITKCPLFDVRVYACVCVSVCATPRCVRSTQLN